MSIDNNIDFKDHIVQYPNRFKQTTVAPGIVELVPTWIETPEQIIQPGTPVDSELFKKLKENVTCYSQTYTATEGQTVFSVEHPYNVGQSRISVYIGGVKQRTILDFTESSSTSFILNVGLPAGTKVEAVSISFVQPLANDVQQQIDSILAQYGFNTVRINEANAELSKKADKTYVDRLATSLGSGSPKGVYSTLSALQTAKPTGDSNIYLVTANGNWYYWNGSSWTSGGIYQSVSLPDNSVSYSKLDFLSTSRTNLLDKTKITDGYLSATGIVTASTVAQVTDFIPVESGKTYSSQVATTGIWGSAVYDANKVFIRKFDMTKTLTITDANAKYIRVVYYPKKTLDFDLMFVEGTIYPDEYIPHRVNVEVLDSEFNRLLLNQSFKQEYVNLIDKTHYTAPDGISVTTGAEIAAAGSKRSWYLPIEYGKLYVGNFYNYQYGACYDANKNYLCSIMDGIGTLGTTKTGFYLKRSDIKYIRVTFQNTVTPYVAEGTTIPGTIVTDELKTRFKDAEFRKWIKNDLDVNRPLSGLKWNALGDSITEAPDKTRTYHSIIGSQENIFVRNYGASGTRIAAGAGATVGTEMSTRYANMDNDADIVTCFGGINDMNNNLPLGVMVDRVNTTFYGALHVLLIGLQKKYIGKRIGFISPINYGNATHAPYQQAIRDVCKYYSIPLLDLSQEGMINTVISETNTAYFADGLHPNEIGHDVLARKVKHFLLTL